MEVRLNDLNDIFNKAFGETVVISENSIRDEFGAWDSINHLNLVVELEDHYHISFTMDEIKDLTSVKKIMDTMKGK